MKKKIPMETWYGWHGDKSYSFKKPKYELKTAKEEKEHQEKLGNCLGFYYGTNCDKCCGVYPAFFTEGTFRDYGYYVCLVCGRESKHQPMNWMAKDSWNNCEYKWVPDPKEHEQLSVFDYITTANNVNNRRMKTYR